MLVINVDVVAGTRLTIAVKSAIRLVRQLEGIAVNLNFNGNKIYIPSHSDYSDVYEIVERYENNPEIIKKYEDDYEIVER